MQRVLWNNCAVSRLLSQNCQARVHERDEEAHQERRGMGLLAFIVIQADF